MKTIPVTLLAFFCALFFVPASAQAQEKTIEVKGAIPQDTTMRPGDVYVLKDGPAVRKVLDELRLKRQVAQRAATDVEKVLGEEPKANEKNKGKVKKWEKSKSDAEKKFKKQLEVYEAELKKYEDILAANKGEKVSVDEKGAFAVTVPASASFFYSAKKEDRGYIWITKATGLVKFENPNRTPDSTIKPKVEEKKK